MVLIGFNLGIVSCEDNVKMENESRVDSDKRTLSYLDRLGGKIRFGNGRCRCFFGVNCFCLKKDFRWYE